MQKHRKLAAIMFTDIVGYTALMAKDEDNALRILQRNRDIVKLLVSQFSGEFLKEIGDGTLCSFSSVVDAVNCALEIQHLLKNEPDFKLRIGIHIGDVVVEGGDVFGDGVNVASRIENLAEPGGICISDRVYYDIKNKPVLEATFLGEKKLKNVESPVKVYSLTRGGEQEPVTKPAVADHDEEKQEKRTNRWIIPALVVIVVIIAGLFIYSRFVPRERPEAPVSTTEDTSEFIKSIAVLPFTDMSPEKDQDWYCEGIAETIIDKLNKFEELRVISRNSSFVFKGEHRNIKEIGDSLGVDTVLEGSIQKSGNRLRITAQLINVADESHLFSKQFDHVLDDIFAIQDTISIAIAELLMGTLQIEEKVAIEKRPTDNLEAYDMYLLGRNYLNKWWINGNVLKALEYFEKAIDRDPNFALAYTGKADTYFYGYEFADSLSTKESWQRGKDAAQTALRLNENLAEAHNSFARLTMCLNWDWAEAERHFSRALELNPNYAQAHWHYHDYLWVMGRADEAILEMKKAQELNPLAVDLYFLTGWNYSMLGRYDEATEQFDKALKIDPDSRGTFWRLMQHYYYQKNYKKAIDTRLKYLKLYGSSPETDGWLGRLYALSGERDKAERILEALKEKSPVPLFHMAYININLDKTDKAEQIINEIIERKKDENIASFLIAELYLYSGNKDKAFEWLNKAVEYRDGGIYYETAIKLDPEWAHVRSDPRFKAVLKKMGLE